MSYVTGSHALKMGITGRDLWYRRDSDQSGINVNYTLANGIPTAAVYEQTPFVDIGEMWQYGIFAQDQWTLKRLTMNLGVRFDRYWQGYPDEVFQATSIISERRLPRQTIGDWNDLGPRIGVSYDLFGTGRTVVKGTFATYPGYGYTTLEGRGTLFAAGGVATDTRVWRDLNNNFVIDADASNPAANGELGSRTNLQFGTPVQQRYDDGFFGWGKRIGNNREYSVGMQHALTPRISASATFTRREYTAFSVIDNVALTMADFDPFCVTVPNDRRLPNAGQQLCGLFDVKPAKVGIRDAVTKSASDFGGQIETWQGVDLIVDIRVRNTQLQGGVSTGKGAADTCGVAQTHPQVTAGSSIDFRNFRAPFNSGPLTSTEHCAISTPYQPQFKLAGAYTLPYGFQISGVLQNLPGYPQLANVVYTSAQIATSLGRPLSSATTATINVIKPGTLWGERMNQLDLRLTKHFRVGRTRVSPTFDVYNALNGNAIVSYNRVYGTTGATWNQPGTILAARLVKLGGMIAF